LRIFGILDGTEQGVGATTKHNIERSEMSTLLVDERKAADRDRCDQLH
jgi:hypothetical protein